MRKIAVSLYFSIFLLMTALAGVAYAFYFDRMQGCCSEYENILAFSYGSAKDVQGPLFHQGVHMEKVAFERPSEKEKIYGIEAVHSGNAEYDGKLLHLSGGMEAVFGSMVVKADQGIFYPKESRNKFDLEKMVLTQNVQIISRSEEEKTLIESERLEADFELGKLNKFVASGGVKMQRQGLHKEYALADIAEYNAGTKMWKFTSSPPRRVLYYDLLNSMTISAPEVIVQQMEGLSKPRVKASGDVRFSFADKELDEIRQRFQFNAKGES